MKPGMEELIRELRETPVSATQNLAFLIGYVHVRLTAEQHECAVASLKVLATKAGVPQDVIAAALR